MCDLRLVGDTDGLADISCGTSGIVSSSVDVRVGELLEGVGASCRNKYIQIIVFHYMRGKLGRESHKDCGSYVYYSILVLPALWAFFKYVLSQLFLDIFQFG